MIQQTKPCLVQFGAGNIGRSLVGQLFARAGWEVVFVEAALDVVEAINSRRRYVVRVKDEIPPGGQAEIWVEGVRALAAQSVEPIVEAIAGADLIGTAVGPSALPRILPAIAAGVARRTRPISIILCENLRGAARQVGQELQILLGEDFPLSARVGLVETSIGKMVPIMPAEVRAADPVEVWAEAYNQIIADADGFIGPPPAVEGLVLKKNFAAYVDRKLFIHNLGHATAAYLGHLEGKMAIWECMADPRLRTQTRQTMWTAAQALIRRYPSEFDERNLAEHIEDLLRRFANRALGDTVFRVGRDLARKLAPDDRLIGALRMCQQFRIPTSPIEVSLAAALHFRAVDELGNAHPSDAVLIERVAQEGPEAVLISVCGFDPQADRALLDRVLARYGEFECRAARR